MPGAVEDMRGLRRIVEAGCGPLREADDGLLDRVQDLLRRAGVSEDEQRAGIDLTPAGRQKVAARLGIAADEVPMLLGSLATRLRGDAARSDRALEAAGEGDAAEGAADARFGFERDGMGNVTVRDAGTGRETFLQGSQAADLLRRLGQDPEAEQGILKALLARLPGGAPDHGLKEAEEAVPDAEDDFMEEMRQRRGTFNFPWKLGARHGFGTARYVFDGHAIKVALVHVRDSGGERIVPDGQDKAAIEDIALDFIREENE